MTQSLNVTRSDTVQCDVCCVPSAVHQSTVGHDAGIAVLSLIIIVIIVVVAILLFRHWARKRRRQNFLSMKSPLGSGSAVNFVTMMEEPEMEFHPRDRQLSIIQTPRAEP